MEIMRDGKLVEFPPSRKTRALLGYLITTAKQHSRKHLCDLLWEHTADPRASLRWSLSKIRNLLGERESDHILTIGDFVQFIPGKSEVDVYQVQSIDRLDTERYSLDRLEDAVTLFRGDFLEDCEITEAYRFSTWLDSQRERLNRIQHHLFTTLCTRIPNNPEKAIHYTRQLLQLDPYDEQAHIRLIELLGKCGDTKKALKQYNHCKKILKEELAAEPSPALEKARLSLIKLIPYSKNKKEDTLETAAPLIGRVEEQATIGQIIAEAQKKAVSNLVLLSGEPGIGKTHMLRHTGRQIQKAGGEVLWGEANYLQMNRPYAPWANVLHMIKTNTIPESIWKYITPLMPGAPSEPAEGDRNSLFAAVLEALHLFSSGSKPIAVLFDNLHWFDDPSIALLNFISRETANSDILIFCSARPPELEANTRAFWLINAHRREKQLTEIKLNQLTKAETLDLIKTIDPSLNAEPIYVDSKGNPLFAMEMAYALQSGGSPGTPTSLHSLIQERLAILDSKTKSILNWMAVWGHDIRLDLLCRASEIPLHHLLASVEMLERFNIIKTDSAENYSFVHHLVQNVAYQNISAPRRKVIHQRIAQTLMEDEQSKHAYVALLHHAGEAEDSKLIVHACLSAARKSMEVFAFKEAEAFIKKGMTHLERLSQKHELSLRIKFLELYVHPGMVSFRKEDLMEKIKASIGDAREARLNEVVHKGLFLISNLYYQQGDFQNALRRNIKAEEAGRLSEPITMIHALADTAKCYGMLDQKIDRAEALAKEAEDLALEMDLENKIYEIHMALALVKHHRGQYDQAIGLYNQSLERIRREEEDHWWECYNLQRFPMVEMERNRPSEALRYCGQLMPVALNMGEGSETPFAKALQALALCRTGKTDASEMLDQQLGILRRLDSKWMIAYLQIMAAEHDLSLAVYQTARNRAKEALDAASCVGRFSEIALACSLLIQISLEEGTTDSIHEVLSPHRKQLKNPSLLSNRASEALEKAALLSGIEI